MTCKICRRQRRTWQRSSGSATGKPPHTSCGVASVRLVRRFARFENRVVRTHGDDSTRSLRELGDGTFVTALEDALRRGEIDVAVHSLKDVPTDERPGLVIGAIPERADPRDVLVSRERLGLASLSPQARVGTGSPRRAAFLRALRPDLVCDDVRGNVDTRLAKVRSGEYEAVVLALAGLVRLGIDVGVDEILTLEEM